MRVYICYEPYTGHTPFKAFVFEGDAKYWVKQRPELEYTGLELEVTMGEPRNEEATRPRD